jgi:hypothetical protein
MPLSVWRTLPDCGVQLLSGSQQRGEVMWLETGREQAAASGRRPLSMPRPTHVPSREARSVRDDSPVEADPGLLQPGQFLPNPLLPTIHRLLASHDLGEPGQPS